MLVGSGATNAFAAGSIYGGGGKDVADAMFTGTAITGVGAPMPIVINPTDITIRGDGAIGIGYIYQAAGDTSGKAAGHFVYDERGYLYFRNPADPTSFVGAQYTAGWFTLTLRKGGVVVIRDTSPGAYNSGVNTITAPKGFSKALSGVTGKGYGQLLQGGPLTYGYFTFSDNYGTFIGYSTPDWRQFAIEVKFDCPVC